LLDEWMHVSRSLRRAPSFTILAVTILALGIGTSAAVFEAFRSVALVDLPVSEPERIVTLSLHDDTGTGVALTPDEIDALNGVTPALQAVAGALSGTGTMPVTEDDRPLVLDFAFVTSGFFNVLGARPALGRLFQVDDGAEGASPVTVISYRTWQREFGGAPDVPGRALTATQYQGRYEIVGVAPPGLDYPVGVDYWILPGPRRQALDVIARMAPGVGQDRLRSEFLSLAQSIDSRRDDPGEPVGVNMERLSDAVVGNARPILIVVTAAAALLLFIACANVAGLLLMRSARRSRDITVRRALGASSARIARWFVLEGVLLGVVGGALGLILASGLLGVLPRILPSEIPRPEMIGLGGVPIGVAVIVTVLAMVLVTALPFLAADKVDLTASLRQSGRWASSTRGARQVRRTLVGAQVALAVIVLFGAGLLARTLQHLSGLDLGYEAEHVSVMELGIDRRNLGGPAELADLLEGVFEELRALPGVRSVSPLMARPFTGGGGVFQTTPLVEGQPELVGEAGPTVPLESGGPEIFETLGIPLLQGRGFLESDREDAPNVAVVSRALASRWWPDRDPIGQRIRLSLGREEWWTVVGVAGETRFRRLRQATPTIYLPWRQFQILPMAWTVAVRSDGDPSSLAPAMREAARSHDARVYLWTVGSLRDHLSGGPMAAPRTTATVLLAFGLAALFLAAAGLYGVMALAVQEQTRELGIRRALGASERVLRRDVLSDALRTTLLGSVTGLGVALFGSRLLEPLLFGVGPGDPVTMVGVFLVILAMSVLAAYAPVRHATRVDPRIALHGE
jgi:predicted permease